MTHALISVLLLLSVAQSTAGQKPDAKTIYKPDPELKLELKTEVLRQTYCARDHFRMGLRFTFVNTGSMTLILYRFGTIVPRSVVSKDRHSLAKRKYLSDARAFIGGPFSPSREQTETLAEDLFVILKPGESFSTHQNHHLFLDDGSDSNHKLRPGRSYVLQLRVATWWNDSALALELQERWRDTGMLWYYDLVTQPMDFSIKPYDAGDKCD